MCGKIEGLRMEKIIKIAQLMGILSLLLLVGCYSENCKTHTKMDCSCDKDVTSAIYTTEYLGDKCNCCWDDINMNNEGFYERNRICIGGDSNFTEEEYCTN